MPFHVRILLLPLFISFLTYFNPNLLIICSLHFESVLVTTNLDSRDSGMLHVFLTLTVASLSNQVNQWITYKDKCKICMF